MINNKDYAEQGHWIQGGVGAPLGFKACGVMAGIKYQDKYDVALIVSDTPAQAAGVYTRNLVKAHPVLLTQKHLQNGQARAVVVNSGNANACVGKAGDDAAYEMARKTASELGLETSDVVVASTGVIGVEMPMTKVQQGIEAAARGIREMKPGRESGEACAHQAALAIMTTDTTVKEFACELPCGEGSIRIGGIAKGSGMIHPNMGTMLSFITTDAVVSAPALQQLLKETVEESFNMVTVDGDTSTNDMLVVLANGASGFAPAGEDWRNFTKMFKALCIRLAKEIARDGEGAGKFIEVRVQGARSLEDARKAAKSICGSSLVKTAIFGEDANWGRILCAAGYSEATFDPAKTDVFLGPVQVAKAGQGVHFSEAEAKGVLKQKEVRILVDFHCGDTEATAWGCDLTHEYVTINGSYRT